MDKKIENWCKKYRLKSGKLVGYRGGYPIVEFELDDAELITIGKKELDRNIRKAELSAGLEIGVGYNFRKTGFAMINDNKLCIAGHELVIDKFFESVLKYL